MKVIMFTCFSFGASAAESSFVSLTSDVQRGFAGCALSLFVSLPAVTASEAHTHNSAGGWTGSRPDGHAPIGVMGEHIHGAGEWMLSYRFMTMSMDGLRDGTSSVSADDVLRGPGKSGYMAVPQDMTMNMHMIGAMYAPTDKLTLMVMGNYITNDMSVRMRMPMMGMPGMFMTRDFETESSGFGDIKISGLYALADWQRQRVHANIGLSIPTGSIDEKDATPMSGGQDVQLPYSMQLGSGTWDLLPGVTYMGQTDDWSWGAQGILTLRLGENSNGYTLGNRIDTTAWGAWRASDWVSLSTRLSISSWGNIDGSDEELQMTPAMNPNADPNLRGGHRADLSIGGNLMIRSGFLQGNRVALEIGMPVIQNLDGPQLETDWWSTLGWQLAF